MSAKFIVYCLIIFSNIVRYGLECNGQELYSFRQEVIGGVTFLQIFAIPNGGSVLEWYNILQGGTDYRETYYACRNLSNTAMVEYARTEGNIINGHNFFDFECDSLPEDISGCDKRDPTTNTNRNALLVTCLNFTEHDVGDVIQLDDGRIIQLVEFSNGRFVWAHYCFNDNDNWGVLEANLACQSLGFDRVKEGREKIEIRDKRVYGLIEVDCQNANAISQCNAMPRGDNGRCGLGNSVIAIECENIPTLPNSQTTVTQPVSTSGVTEHFVSVTTQDSVSQTIRTVSNSTLPPVPLRTPLITAVIAILILCIVLTLIASLLQIFGIFLTKMLRGCIIPKRSNENQTKYKNDSTLEVTQECVY